MLAFELTLGWMVAIGVIGWALLALWVIVLVGAEARRNRRK